MNYTHRKPPKYLKNNNYGKKSKKSLFLFIIPVVLIFVTLYLINATKKSAPLVISKIVGGSGNLESTDGRVNILALGVDKRSGISTVSGTLTDSIIIGSIAKDGSDAAMVSVPRDLWVPYGNSQYSGKINAVYSWGGVEEVIKTVERVFNIPIHYYGTVGFDGFIKAVDTVGGLEVNVERAFDDYKYPIEGKEGVYPEEDRYSHVHFDSGVQVMQGEAALQFARSRHALGDEGTDFARASRQQKILVSFKDRIFSSTTMFNPSRIKLLYDIFKESVETNVSLEEALQFYDLAKKLDSNSIKSMVLNGDLLYNPADTTLYSGAWVLIPKAGDFSEIQAKLQELLKQQ